ncbi:MAG: hypothetical protein ACYC6N_09085 [Pirellulaceae bacterium]
MSKSIKPPLSNYGQTLIDALFHEQDQELARQFHERMEKRNRRQELAKLCGVEDEALLDHLVALDLQPEAVAALSAIPLVVVAWADHTVQEEERKAVIRAAEACGVSSQDGRYPVLEYWLNKRPKPELLDAWKHYIAALCRQLSPAEVEQLKHDMLQRARQVAEAAGGLLGYGNKISANEQKVLQSLEEAFG